MQASNRQPLNFCTLLVGVCALVLAGCSKADYRYPGSKTVFQTYDNTEGSKTIAAITEDPIPKVAAWYAEKFSSMPLTENLGNENCFRRKWATRRQVSTLTACEHDNVRTLWLTWTGESP
jgi:hypothetical protein